MQSLPGFRDIFPAEFARRRYVFETWRRVARSYGFVEYDGPMLEALALYSKKNESGAEILQQLYHFDDRNGRAIALRPEMTPTLARMVASGGNAYRKPLKWFSIGSFFRHERPQKGRLREFVQLNCDILGDESPAADAELMALAIDLLRAFGFGAEHFAVRVSSRAAWVGFLRDHGVVDERVGEVLAIIDKLDRDAPEVLDAKLAAFGLERGPVEDFIRAGAHGGLDPVLSALRARGLGDYVVVDLAIVRGLAYYTGTVFELFDRGGEGRAIAGGGRYDGLIAGLSDGAVDLPAIGFGMGDVVLDLLIGENPVTSARRDEILAGDAAVQVYVVVAAEDRREQALGCVQSLRDAGWRVDFSPGGGKVGKQFQSASASGARFAVVVGGEWPEVSVKALDTRAEDRVAHGALAAWLNSHYTP